MGHQPGDPALKDGELDQHAQPLQAAQFRG
jgi:hypothetical protein